MGHVYRARDRRTGDAVALKTLLGAGSYELTRFAREAQALAATRLPGVVRDIAHGETGSGLPYLAMAWLTGETLAERLGRHALTTAESAALAYYVATTLGRVHRLGLERTAEALAAGREALSLVESVGAEEGESLVRLVYAEARTKSGMQDEARRAFAAAWDNLLARAGRLKGPVWRERFLKHVPDNARTLELASHWLG